MISIQPYKLFEELKYIGIVTLVLVLLSSCASPSVPQSVITEPAGPTLVASMPPSISTPMVPTLAVSTPTATHVAAPSAIVPLPTAQGPVSEALFVILTEDGTRLLAAYEGETRLRVLYEISPELGTAQITFHPARFPVISHDGKWVAVIENKTTGRSDIYRLEIALRKVMPILTWAGPQFEATISPDGRQVAFLSAEGECPERKGYDQRYWCPDQHLYVMDIDGSNIKRLTTKPAHRCFLSWSPAGTQLAYQEGCDPTEPSQVYLMTLLNGGTERITQVTQNGGAPDWSPDGKWLYLGSQVGLLGTTGDVAQQFDLGAVTERTNITWSPDSKQIAQIIAGGYSEVIQIWSLGNNVQKQNIIPLPNIVSSLRFKWLSDGKRFALAGHSRDSNYQIADKLSWFIMNIDGTHLIEVSDH